MTRGKLIAYSGPSGVGKGYVLNKFFDIEELKLNFSISATTRKPREGEIHGNHYYFLSKEEFEQWIAENKFYEWAEFVGNYYGTPKEFVNKLLDNGQNVIMDIEILGVKQLKKIVPDLVTIWLMPPSIEVLEKRLEKRGTEDSKSIKRRIKMGLKDMEEAKKVFDYHIINEDGDIAAKEVANIILKEMNNEI